MKATYPPPSAANLAVALALFKTAGQTTTAFGAMHYEDMKAAAGRQPTKSYGNGYKDCPAQSQAFR